MSRPSKFDIIEADLVIAPTMVTQGTVFFVKPSSGNDAKDGKTPATALATLVMALSKCTAGKNDTVYLMSESNSASATTDYQSATLDWNKDLTHLIGVNAGGPVAQRSRIALISSYVTASNLFTVSANGCLFRNLHFFAGVADTNPTGCVNVTGERNRFVNCHIAGIGSNEMDIAGAYSLKLTAAAENLFDDCTIGLDTIARGSAANSGLLVDGAATRNEFRDCRFIAWVEHATNHVHVRLADATAVDRYLLFERCLFAYMSTNYGVGATGVMKLTNALTKGYIIVNRCTAFSDKPSVTVKWDVDDRNKTVVMASPTPAADTAGVGRWV